MLKIAICDDMKADRDKVYEMTLAYCQAKNLETDIRCYDHPDKLVTECERFRPHIYILDIVMPMITGIQAARELRWNQPDAQIIFATSESSFALESFDVNPINFIVKPVDPKKLSDTLDLAIRRTDLSEEKAVTVKIKGGFRTIDLQDIMYIDYRNHVVSYHLHSKEVVSTPTLRIGFAEYLKQNHQGPDFVQCHESVSVHISAIDKLTKTDIVVRNKEMIPVSKSRYAAVSEAYMNYRFSEDI